MQFLSIFYCTFIFPPKPNFLQKTKILRRLHVVFVDWFILCYLEKAALSARLAALRRGMAVTVRYFQPDLLCPADPPVGRYQTVTGTVQTLDPVQKTLRLVLDSPHTGPGVEKEKVVVIPLEDIAALA